MLSQIYYLIRSRKDGQYLVAHPQTASEASQKPDPGYLLMFREHFDALSYLNKYASDVTNQFAVESVPGTQLNALLSRWSFKGFGIVQDPLIPRVEFFSRG